ncbi:MAG: citrate synthase, partial [Parasporobacterium sp.]|nr:citrate synthase [Parasporobacterium sp.]
MIKTEKNPFSENTPQLNALAELCMTNNKITPELFHKYNVKRGLRDERGQGVLTGLTEIAEVKSYTIDDAEMIPCPGKLYYRGYDLEDLAAGFGSEKRFGYEETAYLLMFGELPTEEQLKMFTQLLNSYRSLPTNFVRDIILKAPSADMMNTLARSVLTLYAYDDNPDDVRPANVLRQCLELTAVMPLLAVYGYQAYCHYKEGESLFIHQPKQNLSTAETIFHLLRPDSKYTKLEASVLDLCLVIHADHGGGNNSTFTTRVVTSTLTDTYSTFAAALGSLKGPRHGGANIKVCNMMDYIKSHVKDWN